MSYPFHKIAQVLNGSLLQAPNPSAIIEHLLIDSRQVSFAHSTLFFALVTKRRNGHNFVKECYTKGVRNFIVSQKIDTKDYSEANFLLVEDSLKALQQLASFHRHQFKLNTIGITGSNGKTVVKEWLFQLLNEDYHLVRSPKSYNSQIGVPLSLWQIQKEHDLGIFEAGISERGEMEKIAPVLDCNIGVFTNIGMAHQAGFPDLKSKLKEKLRLFKNAQTLVYCRDNYLVEASIKNYPFSPGLQKISWSKTGKEADFKITSINENTSSAEIKAFYKGSEISIQIPFTDDASVENAINCWLVCLHLKLPFHIIQKRMARLERVEMRLEVKEGINNCLVINDAYNSDLTSLSIALNFLQQQSKTPKKTLILSDIHQSGQDSKVLYQKVAQLIKEKQIDKVIGIGKNIRQQAFTNQTFESTRDFLQNANFNHFQNETVLLKGARTFQFEKIAERLAKKVHKTVLEVDLDALQHNLRVYSNHLRPGTKMMAMVKASAYGSGAIEVAKRLEFSKVNYLGVAYADEGVELRKAGIQLPIMVLSPEAATFNALLKYDLEPEIHNLQLLQSFTDFLIQQNTPVSSYPIHLKIDTGMHRLGFEEDHLEELIEFLKNHPQLKVQSILSHLAASEAAIHDGFTQSQIDLYKRLYAQISKKLGYTPIRHILNSGGIIRFPEHQMDMVRLGIGLYGIDSSGLIQDQLQVVSTLKASISQIKNIAPGETVSYGRSGKATQNMRIATVSIGYADGLPRLVGNGNFSILINNQKAPIFGTVCMDMCMVDITHIPNAQQGDEAVIFGKELSVEVLAKAAKTIPYEIFTGISGRVKRVYFQE